MRPHRRACRTLVLAALTGACGPRSDWYGTTTPRHGADELWVNNSTEPEWIDPGKCSDGIGGTIISNTFEGLLAADPATMAPVPGMAERWDVSDDRLVWTFHLRENLRWSDGEPLTASDFVWSWTRVLDPRTASKYADEMFVVRNGDAFNQGAIHVDRGGEEDLSKAFSRFGKIEKIRVAGSRDAFAGALIWMADAHAREAALAGAEGKPFGARPATADVLGLRAIDDRTFEVTLQDPIPYFLPKITTLYTFSPVPRRVLERLEREGKDPDLWTRPENFVSNGPFVLTEWRFRQYMVFEKNPYYREAGKVRLARVVAKMIEANTTGLQMYKAGEVDFSGENVNMPAELVPMLRGKKDFTVAPWLSTYWYWINVTAPGMTDPRVRHALNLAVDKREIVEHVTRQGQLPATSVIQGGLSGYEQLEGEGFDPERARTLLADAGFPGGHGMPKISILFNTNETHRSIAEAIQEMWRKHLGLEVELANQEWSVFLRDLDSKQFQVARLGWTGDYPDPFTFLSVFLSESGNNRSNWKSPEFDGLVARSNSETDPSRRLALMRQAEGLVMRDLPVIPLYWYTRGRMVKPYVHGVDSNFLDRHPWKAIWIESGVRP